MAKKLLIDAAHPEEIRVAVVRGDTLDEFDSETSHKKHIKSNIYLAKVVRVEPSLQAAFVDYGGNRHGFLPFSEIHPDYYRIPVSDRETTSADEMDDDVEEENLDAVPEASDFSNALPIQDDIEPFDDDGDEKSPRPKRYKYKIQEVIKRRQIMLVQVVKEERGNKGAALTTYLSLPGRYCVLMPNAGYRSGGVSRKINDGDDRKRLKDLVKSLEVPEGMGLIVRTAGQERNKIEIKRDYEYLVRLWSDIRELTLQSVAPVLVYEEGDLVKKSIRDIYCKDMDQILVEGEEAYKEARAFMKALIPSHVRKVQLYKDVNNPLFYKFKVESQIDAVMEPIVQLPSGGYVVINVTEALVAIDVNSGRSTRERNIESTALKTNLEAADEIARQMRLRDLAGLIVIDFIDMSDNNYIQQVERRLRESIKTDRARIQVGRISQFGLMELSRQRLRPSIIESYTTTCGHCQGTGLVHSIESTSLRVLRAVESLAIRGKSLEITAYVPTGIDSYLLNQKRAHIVSIEEKYNVVIQILWDASLVAPHYRLDSVTDKDKKEVKTQEATNVPERRATNQEQSLERPRSDYKKPQNKKGKAGNHLKQTAQKIIEEEIDLVNQVAQQVVAEELLEIAAQEGTEETGAPRKRNYHQRRRDRQRFHRNRRRHNHSEGNNPHPGSPAELGGNSGQPHASENVVPLPAAPSNNDEGRRKSKKGWLSRLLD